MQQKVVIAGGTGFIGHFLNKKFTEDGYQVVIISRQKEHVSWQNNSSIVAALEGAAMLINLAGKPINTIFSPKNKAALISSRVDTTLALGNALLACKKPPSIWLNASGAHIYGTSDGKAHTEADPADHSFFPAIMAKEWEDALYETQLPNTRKVALRISIVLGKNGGVLQPFIMLAKLLLGGKQGSGRQKFSWVHLEDFYQIILFIATQKTIEGAVNICAPEVVDNAQLMRTLRKTMKVPFGIPAPAFGIKIGARIMGIEPDLILKSLSVFPQKLLAAGYTFRYPTLAMAMKQILK
ncbi:MAG: TIGR01777 family protein [Chitinophagaceae bacterium]|nr:TIGR01777 family protein [Chitinophagaceae bacterium]